MKRNNLLIKLAVLSAIGSGLLMLDDAPTHAKVLPSMKSMTSPTPEERPDSLPSDAELEATGTIVGKIYFNALQLFDTSHPEEDVSLFRLANRVHIRSAHEFPRSRSSCCSGNHRSDFFYDAVRRFRRTPGSGPATSARRRQRSAQLPLRYQAGDGRWLFAAEQRYFTNWFPFQLFNVGGAVFYDMGSTFGRDPLGFASQGLLKDIGFGVRLGSNRSTQGNVLHIDVAFPFDGDPSIKNVQFLLETKHKF